MFVGFRCCCSIISVRSKKDEKKSENYPRNKRFREYINSTYKYIYFFFGLDRSCQKLFLLPRFRVIEVRRIYYLLSMLTEYRNRTTIRRKKKLILIRIQQRYIYHCIHIYGLSVIFLSVVVLYRTRCGIHNTYKKNTIQFCQPWPKFV